MDTATLAHLVKTREYPAVSVLLPTHRRAPENQQDRIRLRNLLVEVRKRLKADELVSPQVAEEISGTLEKAAEDIDLNHAMDGLALFAAPGGESHVFVLTEQVQERVALDETFLTRDVVAALTRPSSYWVLALSDKPSRLWSGHGEKLTEVETDGFPMTHEPHVRTGERSGKFEAMPDERYRKFYREVDDALGAVQARDPRPIVLVGLKRNLVTFEEVTAYAASVIGEVDGGHENASGHELYGLVEPVLRDADARRQRTALTELDAALGERRYAGGLEEVWQLASQGRGAHLLVENGYHVAGRVYEDRVEVPTGDDDGADAADIVDDIIEHVLAHGGEVTFMPDDALADHDRIALITRF